MMPGDDAPGSNDFREYDYSHFYYGAGEDVLDLLGPFARWYGQALQHGYALYSTPMQGAPAPVVGVRDRQTGEVRALQNFASYNYLGLSYRPEVKRAAIEAIERYGVGASGSPILSGVTELHVELAEAIAAFKRKEAAILFQTGYGANVGLISGLMRPGDHIFLDQYAHASIVDGAILAKSKVRYFRHNNAADLDRKLNGCTGKKLVVVEGVYSMDGDVCALPAITAVARRHGARVLVDEAHSTFVFGDNGRGVVEHFGLEDEIDFHLGTFSKSLGGQGGFVCGAREVIDYLNAFARPRFFSCHMAPPVAAGVLAALHIARGEPELRARLWSHVAYLKRRFAEEQVDIGASTSQVIPVMVNHDGRVFAVAEKLRDRGLFIQPVTYPAVPKHKSRLRLSVSAAHTVEQLEAAVQAISAVLREEEIIPCR